MIVGIGVDLVNVPRFTATLNSVTALRPMYFTSEEVHEGTQPRSAASIAMRYAAKEACAKALGIPPGLRFTDCIIRTDPDGKPWLETTGGLAAAAAKLGVTRWHLSMSYEGDVAVAYVVAEADGTSEATEVP